MAFLPLIPLGEMLLGGLGATALCGSEAAVAGAGAAAALGESAVVAETVVASSEAAILATETVEGVVMTETAAATEAGTMVVAEAEGEGLAAAAAESGGGSAARSSMSTIAKAAARQAGKAAMLGGTAAMVMVENPGTTALAYSAGRKIIFGNAKHRPNCNRDPLGAFVCDIQSSFTSLDCAYSPLIVGGTMWAGIYMLVGDWRIPTVIGAGYIAYAYSPIAVGDKQDQSACKSDGLLGFFKN